MAEFLSFPKCFHRLIIQLRVDRGWHPITVPPWSSLSSWERPLLWQMFVETVCLPRCCISHACVHKSDWIIWKGEWKLFTMCVSIYVHDEFSPSTYNLHFWYSFAKWPDKIQVMILNACLWEVKRSALLQGKPLAVLLTHADVERIKMRCNYVPNIYKRLYEKNNPIL